MTNTEKILELLESVQDSTCDDCISVQAGVEPRQQVNQIGRRLEAKGVLRRGGSICVVCGKTKLTNSLVGTPVGRSTDVSGPKPVQRLSPEAARNHLDRFCKALAKKKGGRDTVDSLAALISSLSDSGDVPIHQANMMHTLRSLRNAFVHEHIRMGKREEAILENAWAIIEEWAETNEPELWRLTRR